MEHKAFGAGGPFTEQILLPLDRDGFVRRECPACHRIFKVRSTPLDGWLVYRRLMSRVPHSNAEETARPMGTRFCPYCAAPAEDDAWFTAEQRSFLDKRADAFGLEVRFEQLSHVERTLSVNPSPTFLPMRPERPDAALLPEPDDMRRVPLLCCREEIKVLESWLGTVHCFLCGCEHELGAAVVRQRLEALFGE